MKELPINQIGKSQRIALQVEVQPDAKGVQTHFGRQAGLQAQQGMRTLACQAKRIEQFLIDRFDQLPQMGQPASPRFRPGLPTALMGGVMTSAPKRARQRA
jgi:hypothetical protein